MIALDTSVVVAALSSWHDAHDISRKAAAGGAIAAHALLESYAVLTRLPAPRAVPPHLAGQLLQAWFPAERVLVPPTRLARGLVGQLVGPGVMGGSVYDALIGLTAAAHGAELLTRDQRAARTYEKLAVPFRLLTS